MLQSSPEEDDLTRREERIRKFAQEGWHIYARQKRTRGVWRITLMITSLLFSVSVTVVSGIPEIRNGLPWIVTVISGLAAISTGILSVTKANEQYIRAGNLQSAILREQLLFDQRAGPYAEADRERRILLFTLNILRVQEQAMHEWKTLHTVETDSRTV